MDSKRGAHFLKWNKIFSTGTILFVFTLPDYKEGGDTVVGDGCESHTERLNLSGLQEEVVHKGSGWTLYEACGALVYGCLTNTQRGPLESKTIHTLPLSWTGGLWCNYMAINWFSEWLGNDGQSFSHHSLDFCEPETLRYYCQCWCWTNCLMATWEIRKRSLSKKDVENKIHCSCRDFSPVSKLSRKHRRIGHQG